MRIGSIVKIAVVLSVAGVVALVAVVKSIDVNAYRGIVSGVAKTVTGRDLVINGRLSLRLSANPALVAEDVTFSNAPFGSRPAMVRVSRVEATIGLLPLLVRNVRIDRLILTEPDILLEEDAKGHANWDFQEGGAEEIPPGGGALAKTSFSVDEIRVVRGRLEWRRAGRQTQTFDVARLTLDTPSAASPLAIAANGTWNGKPFDFSGILGSVGELLARAQSIPVKLKVVLPNLVFALDGTVGTTAQRQLDLKLSADTADLAEAGHLFGYELPPLGAGRLAATVTGPSQSYQIVDIDIAAGRKNQINVFAKGFVKSPAKAKGIDFAVGVEADSLSGLGRFLGTALPGSGPVKLAARVTDVPDGVSIADIKGSVGRSDLSGQGKVNLAKARPLVALKLNSTLIDPGEWQSPDSSARPAAKRATAPFFSDEPLPWDALRKSPVDVDLVWHADRIVYNSLVADNVTLPVSASPDKLTAQLSFGALAGGTMQGKLSVETAAKPARAAFEMNVQKVALGRLLDGLSVTGSVQGAVSNVWISLGGAGETPHALASSLAGEMLLVSDAGRIARLPINLLAIDLMRQLLPNSDDKDTEMRCLVSKFSLNGGVARSENLLLDTSRLTVTGQGSVNLASEGIDFTLTPRPKDMSLLSLAMPLDIGGTLSAPEVSPNRLAIAKSVAGMAGGLMLGPLGILLPLISTGSDANPCLAAIEQAKHPAQRTKPARTKAKQPKAQQQKTGR